MAKRKNYESTSTRITRSKTKEAEIIENNEDLSDAQTFECVICMEFKPIDDIFNPTACSDVFCNECVISHVDAKVQENTSDIKCPEPDCKELIPFEGCFGIISNPVLNRWEEVISKSMISSIVSFYCPYKDCSAGLLQAGDDAHGKFAKPPKKAECPHCKRSFCAECKAVAWDIHIGLTCEQFQKIWDDESQKEDIELRKLVQIKRWGRCPKCKFYVERTSGCNSMVCRCGYNFCYTCGSLGLKCGGRH